MEFAKQVVAQVMGKPVTQGQLSKAFDKVANKNNWKFPINTGPINLTESEIPLIAEAVVFFTGSVPKFEKLYLPGVYQVTAAGYYATIGA